MIDEMWICGDINSRKITLANTNRLFWRRDWWVIRSFAEWIVREKGNRFGVGVGVAKHWLAASTSLWLFGIKQNEKWVWFQSEHKLIQKDGAKLFGRRAMGTSSDMHNRMSNTSTLFQDELPLKRPSSAQAIVQIDKDSLLSHASGVKLAKQNTKWKTIHSCCQSIK